MSPKPFTHKDAVAFKPLDWTGLYPPALPAKVVPDHVAVVMDGNGRWANARGLTRIEGHKAGEAALLDVVAGAIQMGVKQGFINETSVILEYIEHTQEGPSLLPA